MLVKTKSGSEGVGDTVISTTNGVLSSDKITTGNEAEGGENCAESIAEAVADLAGIGSLSEGGDAVATGQYASLPERRE